MTTEPASPMESLSRKISKSIARIVHEHTGRGPTSIRTTIDGTLIVCLIEESLTKGERVLVANGDEATVLALRYRFQVAMRDATVAEIELLTGRRVTAFLSANHIEPDLAIEAFVLGAPI